VYCNAVVPSVTPAGSPTPTPASWYKIKDNAFIKKTDLSVNIPTTPIAFDTDDSGDCSDAQPNSCFIMGQAGSLVVEGAVNLSSGLVSKRDWQLADSQYSFASLYDPSLFLLYTRAKRTVNNLTDLNNAADNSINIIFGNYTLTDDTTVKDNAVIFIDGNLTINVSGSFNSAAKSVAYVVTGNLNITSQVTQLNGIFIVKKDGFGKNEIGKA